MIVDDVVVLGFRAARALVILLQRASFLSLRALFMTLFESVVNCGMASPNVTEAISRVCIALNWRTK